MTSLPADAVTETPASTLPLDQATVRVRQRVVDVVKDERQHIAVVAGRPMSVPVVDAKPTKRPGYSVCRFRVSVSAGERTERCSDSESPAKRHCC
ncbi:hypothetical protein OVX87_33025 [Klebsiella pneumoniae]|nr:hypothetical protein [Klebsiella pneumoniae]